MQTKTNIYTPALTFRFLPDFAAYLINDHLEDFVRIQMQFGYELDIPLLRRLSHISEEDLFNLSVISTKEWLDFLAENQAAAQIEDAIAKWKANNLPPIDKTDVVAEDITMVMYLRKKSFLHFLPGYTTDMQEMLELIKEIDHYLATFETALTRTFIDLLKQDIEEHSHFIQQITNTSPSAIYVFDVQNGKGLYANDKMATVFGYTQAELNELGVDSVRHFIHPDDLEIIKLHNLAIQQAADGEIKSYRYRIKDKEGNYRWVRHYESVFKRAENGTVSQTIGIAIDVDKEKKTAEQLQRREAELVQAQAIAHIGSFSWDIHTNDIEWSDELYRIYGLPLSSVVTPELISSFTLPEDIERAKAEMNKTIEQHLPHDFYYRIVTAAGEQKVLHATGKFVEEDDGKTQKVLGTLQDVTYREHLLEQLQKSETKYRQAEEMANMGNWVWNARTNTTEWTDQLYRIYGLEPQSEEITTEKFLSFVHPEDRSMVQEALSRLEKSIDCTFRIITNTGEQKTMRSIGQVQYDKDHNITGIIGIERDITEKQNLINDLKKNQDLYRQAQELAKLGNWTLDLKTELITWSEEIHKIYELKDQTTLALSDWKHYLHPDEQQEVLRQLNDCILHGKLYDQVHRIILPGGKEKILHRKAQREYDTEGNPVRLVGTTQDITDQYRVQQELKENQSFIRKITDAAPSIIASYNIHTGKYSFVSEGLTKLLGYPPEEALEKGIEFFVSLVHPDDLQALMEKNEKGIAYSNAHPEENDLVYEFIYRLRHINGEYRWFQTYGTVFDRNRKGEVENILNITHDITDRIYTEERLKEQEHFIKQLADASPTILYVFNVAAAAITYVNKEIYFVLGYTTDEVEEMKENVTSLLYHPEDYALLPERKLSDRRFQQRNSMIQYECRMKAQDGEWKWLLIREVIFKTDEEDNATQILGAALDITPRKEMERSLLQNSFQLKQSNASLEEFAYVASHDLKEPLRKISTFGDRLVTTQQERLSDDGKIYLNKIVDASQRMQNMINDLLSISMISGNRGFESYNLQTILDDVRLALEFKIEQKNAVIEAPPLPTAHIIPSQFRQLFQNLISNSLKFVREEVQPRITIHAAYLEPEEVTEWQLKKADQYLKLVFEDNGIGFEKEYAGKIFQIFQRLHGRSEYEGTGIGLSICKKIVEHHGGAIYAEGKPGEGAVFTIIIPA